MGDSAEAQRARLALAEWQYAQLNVKQARETLKPLLVSNAPERGAIRISGDLS